MDSSPNKFDSSYNNNQKPSAKAKCIIINKKEKYFHDAYSLATEILHRSEVKSFNPLNESTTTLNSQKISKCPFVTMSICSTSSIFFETSSSNNNNNNNNVAASLKSSASSTTSGSFAYHLALKTFPPICGQYHPQQQESQLKEELDDNDDEDELDSDDEDTTTSVTPNPIYILANYIHQIHLDLGIIDDTNNPLADSNVPNPTAASMMNNAPRNHNLLQNAQFLSSILPYLASHPRRQLPQEAYRLGFYDGGIGNAELFAQLTRRRQRVRRRFQRMRQRRETRHRQRRERDNAEQNNGSDSTAVAGGAIGNSSVSDSPATGATNAMMEQEVSSQMEDHVENDNGTTMDIHDDADKDSHDDTPQISPQEQEILNTISPLTKVSLQTNQCNNDEGSPMYPTIQLAQEALQNLGKSIPRRVCQHPFKRNDIVWVCRTCQSDETCVLCHECFSNSNHEGHDVAFYHAQAGGCCDCGDKDAWDPSGFCNKHGMNCGKEGEWLEEGIEDQVRGVVVACGEWLVDVFGQNVERAYARGTKNHKHRTLEEDVFAIFEGELAEANMSDLLTLEDGEIHDTSLQEGNMEPLPSIGDEFTFHPEAASTSKSRTMNPKSSSSSSDKQIDDKMSNQKLPPSSNESSSPMEQVFDPEAASTSKSRSSPQKPPPEKGMMLTPAQRLGQLGYQESGLYLILHSDDIHTSKEFATALKDLYNSSGSSYSHSSMPSSATTTTHFLHSESMADNSLTLDPTPIQTQPSPDTNKNMLFHPENLDLITGAIAKLFKQTNAIGDLIVYGTHELMTELGPILSQCWKDGDNQACMRFGALILEKARILSEKHGLMVSIKTRKELWMEVRAKAVVDFLEMLSESCDPLCNQVSLGLGGDVATNKINDDKNQISQLKNMESNEIKSQKDAMDAHSQKSRYGSSYLESLLRSDLKLPRVITTNWHALLLTLLAVPNFKASLANAYCDTYKQVTSEYAYGVGILEKSSYTLSVQFLNRVTYVHDLVRKRDLLGCLGSSLLDTLSVATLQEESTSKFSPSKQNSKVGNLDQSDESQHQLQNEEEQKLLLNPVLDPLHPVLSHRRYSPCISDLKCVLNVPGIARLFSSLPSSHFNGCNNALSSSSTCSLDAWIGALSLGQNMDRQIWRRPEEGHVGIEPKGWVGAFNASISLGSLFDRLLAWEDDDPFPKIDLKGSCIESHELLSAVDLAYYILMNGVTTWQTTEAKRHNSTSNAIEIPPEKRCPSHLPMPTVSCNQGTHLAVKALPVSQCQHWSFHLPLHRFTASCLREVARRPYKNPNGKACGIDELFLKLKQTNSEQNLELLFWGLIEFPLIVISRAAQIRSHLWRRNGSGMVDQVLNYSEPPFCKPLRDADLALMQYALLGLNSLHQYDTDNFADMSKEKNGIGCAHFINLLIHRFGVFDFAGFANAPESSVSTYFNEVKEGLYNDEKDGDNLITPWSYSVSTDVETSVSLLEELLHTLIIFITELPPPPTSDIHEHTRQAKQRLRREVIHRLVSGPKTHSELIEVHHVLPLRDNSNLSEEGKLVNPDDAAGAALEAVLGEVADRRSSRGRIEPDKWELKRELWNEYDPSFFHIQRKSHQIAAEKRPLDKSPNHLSVKKSTPYAPPPVPAHRSFERIRRDITADSCVIALIYRTLHVHCNNGTKLLFDPISLRGQVAYETDAMSEQALGRALHLLTLGAYVWDENLSGSNLHSSKNSGSWRNEGGGDSGSIFYRLSKRPTRNDWVDNVLLGNARVITDCEWYDGEDSILELLNRLAAEGGSGTFTAQDTAIRSGATWLCDFATSICPKAASLIGKSTDVKSANNNNIETEKQRRGREARERAMKKIKESMMKFASAVNDTVSSDASSTSPEKVTTDDILSSTNSLDSDHDMSPQRQRQSSIQSPNSDGKFETPATIPISQLLKDQPQCIICSEESLILESEEQEKRKKKDDKVLAFCGFAQASTVLKGGGVPQSQDGSPTAFVGTHVSLCGHAVHTSCCEAHLKDLSHRGDRSPDKRGDFHCPLCRGLSNCLIPYVDPGSDWLGYDALDAKQENYKVLPLSSFLSSSKWWASRNSEDVLWNGRCSFIPIESPSSSPIDEEKRSTSKHRSGQRGFKSFGKKELYIAWTNAMKPQRFVRRRIGSVDNNQTMRDTNNSCFNCREDESTFRLPSDEISIVTDVWRRVMDQLADVSYRADIKRLGEDTTDFGEFRHHIVEKAMFNREAGNTGDDVVDWPACMMPNILRENSRQELSREKLISKLLQSIQSFTYSCCSEWAECHRLASDNDSPDSTIFSKYGIHNVDCGGSFAILMDPSCSESGESLVFDGRIGRLRYLALALMAATSAIHLEIVQLVLDLPLLEGNSIELANMEHVDSMRSNNYRAPIVFPLLCGHVLTHVVAAMCAACGNGRNNNETCSTSPPPTLDSTIEDTSFSGSEVIDACLHFIHLGFLARVLQVILGSFHEGSITSEPNGVELKIHRIVSSLLQQHNSESFQRTLSPWQLGCCQLVEAALSEQSPSCMPSFCEDINKGEIDNFFATCNLAEQIGSTFLCDAGLILQILAPSTVPKLITKHNLNKEQQSDKKSAGHFPPESIAFFLGLESPLFELESPLVREVIMNWYNNSKPKSFSSDLERLLDCARVYPVVDWSTAAPMASSIQNSVSSTNDEINEEDNRQVASILPSKFKKTMPLLGTFYDTSTRSNRAKTGKKQINGLPISYTDLYAVLGSIMPESELTAVCLICGEVINVTYKGECTKHASECGGGVGMFFLLQDCIGLLLHKEKAAYMHSPYVDNHGETPQYRGRPLNLDLSRYRNLHELYSGHLVRQEVISERSQGTRNLILPNLY